MASAALFSQTLSRSFVRRRTALCSASAISQILSHRGMSTSELENVPVVDLSHYLSDPSSDTSQAECAKCAQSLKQFGVVLLRDPRYTGTHNDSFLDTMEAYFNQPHELKIADTRPELHFQVGATPSEVEVPMCQTDIECLRAINNLTPENRPHPITGADPKWRFFWRVGDRPTESHFDELNAAPVLPAHFPDWATVMDQQGALMLQAVTSCAEMAADGFGLNTTAFSSRMQLGPHLLAPTGSDLSVFEDPGTVLAGFHNDLNFLTIHGKSRYPGLFVWLREGTRMPVKVPEGCLLVQAGQQMEHLTGGVVSAGMHEVVVTQGTVDAVSSNAAMDRPPWRVSSTLFGHIASDVVLEPLDGFKNSKGAADYPSIRAGDQVLAVLNSIALGKQEEEDK